MTRSFWSRPGRPAAFATLACAAPTVIHAARANLDGVAVFTP